MNVLELLDSIEVEYEPAEKNNVKLVCPFHDDTNPSLHVNTEHGGFHCTSCHEKGPFVYLYAKLAEVDVRTAYQKVHGERSFIDIAKTFIKSIEEVTDIFELTKEKYLSWELFDKTFPPAYKSKHAIHYLMSRSIYDLLLYKEFEIRYTEEGKYHHRIILPIFNSKGCLVSFAARTILPGVLPKTRKARTMTSALYGLHELIQDTKQKKFPYIIIVEGEFDCIYLRQFGLYAVSAMGTSGLSDKQVAALVKYTNHIVLSYDGDAAGDKATKRDSEKFSKLVRTTSIKLPRGKDPNELSEDEVFVFYKSLFKECLVC